MKVILAQEEENGSKFRRIKLNLGDLRLSIINLSPRSPGHYPARLAFRKHSFKTSSSSPPRSEDQSLSSDQYPPVIEEASLYKAYKLSREGPISVSHLAPFVLLLVLFVSDCGCSRHLQLTRPSPRSYTSSLQTILLIQHHLNSPSPLPTPLLRSSTLHSVKTLLRSLLKHQFRDLTRCLSWKKQSE